MTIPLPVIANTFRCALKWTESGTGQTAVNVIHIKANGAGQTAADAYAALNSSVGAAMWDSAVSTAKINEVDITPLDGVTATQSFQTGAPAKWSGSAGGDFIPAAAYVVKIQTAARGRDNRGRVFLPFTAESIQANGVVPSASAAIIGAAWVTFVTDLVAIAPVAWDLGVAAYDRAHAGAGAHFTGSSAIVAEIALGSQRRRQGRVRGA